MSKKILIIDDEKHIRDSFKLRLEKEGHFVDVAKDGAIGLQMINKNEYQVVITDIVMPEREGLDVIQEVKKDHPNIKIIAISGGGRISSENYLNVAQILGANKVLTKPIKMDTLIEAVK